MSKENLSITFELLIHLPIGPHFVWNLVKLFFEEKCLFGFCLVRFKNQESGDVLVPKEGIAPRPRPRGHDF